MVLSSAAQDSIFARRLGPGSAYDLSGLAVRLGLRFAGVVVVVAGTAFDLRVVLEDAYEVTSRGGTTVAVGLPHPSLGEEVDAAVALKPGATITAEELLAFCREHLARFKVPKAVTFLDVLPRNPSGKVLKRELRVEG